jgi:prepilin-type N-terminal cleavage/methylation domain-containing protein
MKLKIYENRLKGFTLLELMVVMSIIGVLLAGAYYSYIQIIERSRINEALSDIQMIRQAIEQYHADTGYYPPDTDPRFDPGFLSYQQINCNAPTSSYNPCPHGYNSTISETSPPTNYRGPYLDVPSWPIETPWGGVYDYDYWP